MKTLKDTINEALISEKIKNKIKNITNKILHPFSKTYDLPYIAIHNGRCYAPGASVTYIDENIDKLINDIEKYLTNKYKDQITKQKQERFNIHDNKSNTSDIDIYEFANCEQEEISNIYTDISDKFIEYTKKLDNSYGKKQIYHENWKKDAYIDQISVELEIGDKTDNKTFYTYPSIYLVTHESIIKY